MNTDTLFPIAMDLLVKSSGILLLAFTVQALWRGASAARRCLVWGAAFVVLLLLPLTLLLPPHWSFTLESTTASAPLAAATVHITETWNASQPAAAQPQAIIPQAPPISASRLMLATWLAGMTLVMGWRVLGAWQLRNLRMRSALSHDARASALALRLAAELGIRRRITVRESAHVSVPLTWGVLRPVLLLPQRALTWSDAALEAALRHELGHIRHCDALTRLLDTLACAVFWPNVLVWLAAKAWRTSQEQACDDVVLSAGGAAQDYAMQLLDAARSMKGNELCRAPVLAMARPSTLESRLSAIMDDTRDRRPLRRGTWIVGGGSVVVLLALCAAFQLQAEEKSKTEPAPAKPIALLSPGQVRIHARFIETPAGALPQKAGQSAAAKSTNAVEAVLTREESAALVKRAEQIRKVTILSSPTVTTRLGQKATIATGKELPDAKTGEGGADWEGIHFEIDPNSGKDDKHLNLGLTVMMRLKKGQDAAGKPAFGEMRFSQMIVNYEPGTTLLIRGSHPSDSRREVVVLVSAEMAPGDAIQKKALDEAPAIPKTKAKANAIILPSVKFRDATLADILDFLRLKSAQLDPDKQGVNIIFADPMPNEASISLDLTNVPLSEALHYVTELANVKFRYDENAITIGVAAEPEKVRSGSDSVLPAAGAAAVGANSKKGASSLPEVLPAAWDAAVGANSKKGASSLPAAVGNLPVLEQANKIILPRVQFQTATAAEAVEFLRVKSKALDPEQKGVNILLRPPGAGAQLKGLTFSLDLKDIPLSEAVKYVAELAGLKVKYEPYAILLEPK